MNGSTGQDFRDNHAEDAGARRRRIDRQTRMEEIRQLKASAKKYDDLACRDKDKDLRHYYNKVAIRYLDAAHAMESLNNALNRMA